jgi:hypothetical protein
MLAALVGPRMAFQEPERDGPRGCTGAVRLEIDMAGAHGAMDHDQIFPDRLLSRHSR